MERDKFGFRDPVSGVYHLRKEDQPIGRAIRGRLFPEFIGEDAVPGRLPIAPVPPPPHGRRRKAYIPPSNTAITAPPQNPLSVQIREVRYTLLTSFLEDEKCTESTNPDKKVLLNSDNGATSFKRVPPLNPANCAAFLNPGNGVVPPIPGNNAPPPNPENANALQIPVSSTNGKQSQRMSNFDCNFKDVKGLRSFTRNIMQRQCRPNAAPDHAPQCQRLPNASSVLMLGTHPDPALRYNLSNPNQAAYMSVARGHGYVHNNIVNQGQHSGFNARHGNGYNRGFQPNVPPPVYPLPHIPPYCHGRNTRHGDNAVNNSHSTTMDQHPNQSSSQSNPWFTDTKPEPRN